MERRSIGRLSIVFLVAYFQVDCFGVIFQGLLHGRLGWSLGCHSGRFNPKKTFILFLSLIHQISLNSDS